jgi:hypothetical protein
MSLAMAKNKRKTSKRFNGKPLAYWQRKADELVVYHLVRAIQHCDRRSIIGELAQPKLWALANSISPDLVKEVLQEQGRCQAGFVAIMGDILGNPKKHPTLHMALNSAGIR